MLSVNKKNNRIRSAIIGDNALHLSAADGSLECMKYLISIGADVNKKCRGFFALYYAVLNQHTLVINYLLDNGAKINEINSSPFCHMETSLNLAITREFLDIALLLIERGATLDKRDKKNKCVRKFNKRRNRYRWIAIIFIGLRPTPIKDINRMIGMYIWRLRPNPTTYTN
jgi:ankyrin repeat protein